MNWLQKLVQGNKGDLAQKIEEQTQKKQDDSNRWKNMQKMMAEQRSKYGEAEPNEADIERSKAMIRREYIDKYGIEAGEAKYNSEIRPLRGSDFVNWQAERTYNK
jgi:hypothetical protein